MENKNEKNENKKDKKYISRIDEFRDEMKNYKPDFLIDQILPTNTVDMLVAEPKAKKSFLAITMAGAIASGNPWLDKFAVKQSPVLYLNLEVAPEYFNEMLNKALGYDYKGELYIAHSNFASPFKFYIAPYRTTAKTKNGEILSGIKKLSLNKEAHEAIVEFCNQVPNLGLIIIDSFRRSTSINENDSSEVSMYFNAISELRDLFKGAAILIIHHATKNPSDPNNPLKTVRGSGDLLASIDNLYQLLPQRDESASGREILTLKTDYGRIKLNSEYVNGIDIGVYDYKDEQERPRIGFVFHGKAYEGATKVEKAKNKIKELLEANGEMSYSEVVKQCAGISETTVKTALKKLKELGEITQNESGLYEIA
jgi:RecA-family ATPase